MITGRDFKRTEIKIIFPAQSRSHVHLLPPILALTNPPPASPATVRVRTVWSMYCNTDAAV